MIGAQKVCCLFWKLINFNIQIGGFRKVQQEGHWESKVSPKQDRCLQKQTPKKGIAGEQMALFLSVCLVLWGLVGLTTILPTFNFHEIPIKKSIISRINVLFSDEYQWLTWNAQRVFTFLSVTFFVFLLLVVVDDDGKNDTTNRPSWYCYSSYCFPLVQLLPLIINLPLLR